MSYQRTQIYLDPDDHRRLVDEARRRGMSLAALLREVVRARLAPRSGSDRKGFETMIGIVDVGEPTDAVELGAAYKDEVLDHRYAKKMGITGRASSDRSGASRGESS